MNAMDALRDSACETLENLAFTELAEEPGAGLPPSGERLGARIGLGPDGELDLYLTRPLLTEIAAILFNLGEDGIDAATLDDTLLEIANIVAGRYLEKLRGGKSDFVLELPRALDAAPDAAPDWEAVPLRLSLTSGPGKLLALGIRSGGTEPG
jgi:hypothetical protein